MSSKIWLIIGGLLSAIAALLHLAVIAGGPAWYRFFGAGEQMARMAAEGDPYPAIITILIASILAIWAAYAFSGAGVIRRLPLLRTGLIVISTVYLARGLILIPILLFATTPVGQFDIWSSLIVLIYGIAYALGTWLRWPLLTPANGQFAS